MKRSQDTFVFPRELGARLRHLRLKSGLTQMELARVMGRAGKKAGNLVGRLERGDERYPSFGIVADFLRGCRAGFKDIADILDLYTNLPTAQQEVFGRALARVAAHVVPKSQSQVKNYDRQFEHPEMAARPEVKRTMPDRMKRLERARRNAAAARRRFYYGQFLSLAVNETGLGPVMTVTVPLFNHGLEWFRILRRTRKSRSEARERLLAECEARFAQESRFPLSAIRKLQDDVRRRFAQMDMVGEMDWLPNLNLEQYEASLLKPARKRGLKQEEHAQFVRKLEEHEAARKAAVEQVWSEVQPMLDDAGVPTERRPVYRGAVGACCTAALATETDSVEERRQIEEYMLNPHWIRLGLDTALAQKLVGIVLARFRELAQSFPPDPRPKR